MGKETELNITKEEFLKAKEVVWTCASRNAKNGITGFNFYLIFANGKRKEVIGGYYWSDNKGYYWHTAWGLSRPLDIYINIGYKLGLDFHDIEQSKLRGM